MKERQFKNSETKMEQPTGVSPVGNSEQGGQNSNANLPKPKNKKWLWWIIFLAILATALVVWQNSIKVAVKIKSPKPKFDKASLKPEATKNLEAMVLPVGFPKEFPFSQLGEEKISLNITDYYQDSAVSKRESQTSSSPQKVIEVLQQFFTEIKWQHQLDPGNTENIQTLIAFDGVAGTMTITAKIDSVGGQTLLSFYANKLTAKK